MLRIAAFCLLAALALSSAASAAVERRVALVIGNGQYVNTAKLPNPPSDARAIADKLKQLGFEVTAGYDLNAKDMQRIISKFAHEAETANVALVFYAGHGMQVDGANWLIPVDADLQTQTDLKFQAVKADDILDAMPPEPAVRILLLDACRDNPLTRSFASHSTRSVAVSNGLAPMTLSAGGGVAGGTVIVYATDPGKVAYDSVGGEHSPFTAALLQHIATPNVDIQSMLTLVKGTVASLTNGEQNPWHLTSLKQIFELNPTAPAAPAQQVAALPPANATPPAESTSEAWQREKTLWDAATRDNTPAAYEAYLAAYPTGEFAAMAKERIEAAKQPAGPTRTAAKIEIPEAVKTTPATEGAEVDLKLRLQDRRGVQQRLTALGYHTGGTDGSFGPMTRTAIKEWQKANGIVETGFLNQPQYDLLIKVSEDALKAAPPAVASAPAAPKPVPTVIYRTVPPRYARTRVYRYPQYGNPGGANFSGAGTAGQFFGGLIKGMGGF